MKGSGCQGNDQDGRLWSDHDGLKSKELNADVEQERERVRRTRNTWGTPCISIYLFCWLLGGI